MASDKRTEDEIEISRFDALHNQRDEAAILSAHVTRSNFSGSGPLYFGPNTPLFNNNNNAFDFDNIKKGDYLEGTQYNALGGNDTIFLPSNVNEAAEAGYNIYASFHAGDGDDVITGGTFDDNIYGDNGNDKLIGASGNDKLNGGTGNDDLDGGSGNDTVRGDDGNDTIEGAAGKDTLLGGNGNDLIDGGIGNDYIDGGAGNDEIYGNSGDDYILGGGGDDKLNGDSGNDIVFGGDGVNFIHGGIGNDTLTGGANFDSINGDEGDDLLNGGGTVDFLFGDNGNDRVYGGEGNDVIFGNAGDDILHGGDGDDSIDGSGDQAPGKDLLFGEAGDDILHGMEEGSVVHGGEGNDRLSGYMLFGDEGDDVLKLYSHDSGKAYGYGGSGNDILVCLDGQSIVNGGSGADTFAIDFQQGSKTIEAAHIITDFEDGVDKIGLWVGETFFDSSFNIGDAVVDFNDVKIFNNGNDCVIADKNSGDIMFVVQNGAGLITEADFLTN